MFFPRRGLIYKKTFVELLPHVGTAQVLPGAQQGDDTNLVRVSASIRSAGQESCAGVHHHVHQGGAENPLQPRRGAQGGSLPPRL